MSATNLEAELETFRKEATALAARCDELHERQGIDLATYLLHT